MQNNRISVPKIYKDSIMNWVLKKYQPQWSFVTGTTIKDKKGAMKKNEMLSFAGKWMELENIILSEVSLAQNQKSYLLPHMRTLDQGQTQQWD
jgi:hypothetical protein